MMSKNDGFLFTVRLIVVAMFACSVLACFGSYHIITLAEQGPIIHGLFGVNCSTDLYEYGEHLCHDSHVRHYTLWRVYGQFFDQPDRGLCSSKRTIRTNSTYDIDDLLHGNIGRCSEASLRATRSFAIMTLLLASFTVIWLAVIADHRPEYFRTSMVLALLTLVASFVTIMVYSLTINPIRLDSTFCDSQTSFIICTQGFGAGFWLQVSTVSLAFVFLLFGVAWMKWGSPGAEVKEERKTDHEPFYRGIHFWVKMGRFAEFVVLIGGVVSSFAVVLASIPPGYVTFPGYVGQPLKGKINLWESIFCNYKVLWWSYILKHPPTQTFGHCTDRELFHVKFLYMKCLVSAGISIAFKKDARENPLFYLIGLFMDFLSLVFAAAGIGMFYGRVYPGRPDIDPPYCQVWTELLQTPCSMHLGAGFILLCVFLVIATANFVGEFFSKSGHVYGASSALETVHRRVREGRLRDLNNKMSARCVTEEVPPRLTNSDNVVGLGADLSISSQRLKAGERRTIERG